MLTCTNGLHRPAAFRVARVLRGNASWSSVALHELYHAMGLAHPTGHDELMDAVLSNTMSGLQSGDRTGLHAMGRSAGCIDLGV